MSGVNDGLQLPGAGLGRAAQAFAGIDAGNGALAHAVVEAVGVAVLDPEPLRGAQLIALGAGASFIAC